MILGVSGSFDETVNDPDEVKGALGAKVIPTLRVDPGFSANDASEELIENPSLVCGEIATESDAFPVLLTTSD